MYIYMHKYTEKTVQKSTYKNVINCERNRVGGQGEVAVVCVLSCYTSLF